MASFELSEAAQRDLREIWDYFAPLNSAAADRLIDDLITAIETVAAFPYAGRQRNRLKRG